MAFNGSGTYVLPVTSLSPTATSGTTIVSADFNTLTSDLETALTLCLTKNGESTPTGDLPMGGNKHTGVADAAALTDYASANQVVDNTLSYCATPSAVGTDAYAVSLPINPVAYAAGNRFQFIPEVANTGACSVDFNSIGPKSIKLANGDDPVDGAIQANVPCDVMYDGTSFILMNPYSIVQSPGSELEVLTVVSGVPAWASTATSLGLYSGNVTVGATPTVNGDTGWTAAQVGTGVYDITHNLGTTDYNIVFGSFSNTTASLIGTAYGNKNANSFRVATVVTDATTTALSDTNFDFMVTTY